MLYLLCYDINCHDERVDYTLCVKFKNPATKIQQLLRVVSQASVNCPCRVCSWRITRVIMLMLRRGDMQSDKCLRNAHNNLWTHCVLCHATCMTIPISFNITLLSLFSSWTPGHLDARRRETILNKIFILPRGLLFWHLRHVSPRFMKNHFYSPCKPTRISSRRIRKLRRYLRIVECMLPPALLYYIYISCGCLIGY